MADELTPEMKHTLSGSDEVRHIRSSSNSKPSGASSGCICCRKKDPPFAQTLVLLRHSEREDRVNEGYNQTEEGKDWPHDCPITKRGVQLAREVSKELFDLHKQVRFSVVVSSPYRRCLETAAEVAKKLKLPVMVDQEMGEVWDTQMSQSPPPWRQANELKKLCKSVKLNVMNPLLETDDPVTNGGIKQFGKPPNWPETLEEARRRYIVRTETYIQRSAETQQNFILVTHADAVAAALVMFERGGADIKDMDFCARVIARRTVEASKKAAEACSAYASNWEVYTHDLKQEMMDAHGMEKLYEKMHIENCEEQEKAVVKRREKRTKTDNMFDDQLKTLRAQGALDTQAEDDDGVEKVKSKPKPKSIRASWEGDVEVEAKLPEVYSSNGSGEKAASGSAAAGSSAKGGSAAAAAAGSSGSRR